MQPDEVRDDPEVTVHRQPSALWQFTQGFLLCTSAVALILGAASVSEYLLIAVSLVLLVVALGMAQKSETRT